MSDTICNTCGVPIESTKQIGMITFCQVTLCQRCAFLEWFSKKHLCRLPISNGAQHRPTKSGDAPPELKAMWAAQNKPKEPTE